MTNVGNVQPTTTSIQNTTETSSVQYAPFFTDYTDLSNLALSQSGDWLSTGANMFQTTAGQDLLIDYMEGGQANLYSTQQGQEGYLSNTDFTNAYGTDGLEQHEFLTSLASTQLGFGVEQGGFMGDPTNLQIAGMTLPQLQSTSVGIYPIIQGFDPDASNDSYLHQQQTQQSLEPSLTGEPTVQQDSTATPAPTQTTTPTPVSTQTNTPTITQTPPPITDMTTTNTTGVANEGAGYQTTVAPPANGYGAAGYDVSEDLGWTATNGLTQAAGVQQGTNERWVNNSGMGMSQGLGIDQIKQNIGSLYTTDPGGERMAWLNQYDDTTKDQVITQISDAISQASKATNVDENILTAMFYQEGGLQPGFTPSGQYDDGQGSVGFSQLIAPNANYDVPAEVGVDHAAVAAGNPYADAMAGARHLADFMDYPNVTNIPQALRAYNSGPDQVGTQGPEYYTGQGYGDPQYLAKFDAAYQIVSGGTSIQE
jgi:hypothetical protein